jgi:hypothetical protein
LAARLLRAAVRLAWSNRRSSPSTEKGAGDADTLARSASPAEFNREERPTWASEPPERRNGMTSALDTERHPARDQQGDAVAGEREAEKQTRDKAVAVAHAATEMVDGSIRAGRVSIPERLRTAVAQEIARLAFSIAGRR